MTKQETKKSAREDLENENVKRIQNPTPRTYIRTHCIFEVESLRCYCGFTETGMPKIVLRLLDAERTLAKVCNLDNQEVVE